MRGICIDMGTSNTVMSAMNRGNAFVQPSVVTIDAENNIITDAGAIAKEALGKAPENFLIVKPMSAGVIADYSAAEGMIKLLAKKAFKRTVFTGLNALVSVPSSTTQMERRAASEAVKNLGVSTVSVIESAMAAAVGAGINVLSPSGSMVIDIGGGTTDIAVVVLGHIATGMCVKQAGGDMDEAIVQHMKQKYNIAIGENTAEKIKIELGCAEPKDKNEIRKYKGQDILSGLPKETALSSEEIREVITKVLSAIAENVKTALEKTPPELLSAVMENGITITGGGANLYGIDTFLTKKTGFKTKIAENPALCVIRGTEKIFSDKKLRHLKKND